MGLRDLKPEALKILANGKPLALKRQNPAPADLFTTIPDMVITCGCGYVPEGSLTYACDIELNKAGTYSLSFLAESGEITYIEFATQPK